MNLEETVRALEILAASPAAKWIGNKIDDGMWLQKCTRCGAQETIVLPPDVHEPKDVPPGFDEKLFDWKRAFQVTHEDCTEGATTTTSTERTPATASTERTPAPTTPPAEPSRVAPDVTMKRVLRCEKHGTRTWRGHIMCGACGRAYQTTNDRQPGHAPEICRCGKRLLPPTDERVGDVLGLQTGGIVIDGEGRRYQTPEAQDWTARSICYLCHRYFAKHHGGRVPVEGTRN